MAIVASGDWWRLESDGTLYVYYNGNMPHYPYPNSHAPWHEYRTRIASVVISDSVTRIGDDTFYNYSALTSVTIGDSVTSIGRSVFEYCSALTSVTIGDSVTSIGNSAFRGTALTSVTIPNSVTSIGDAAFASCSGLTSVTIGDSVTSINANAFNGCSALTDVYYAGTEAQWNAITIGNYNAPLLNATIHYNYDLDAVPEIPVSGLRNPLAAVSKTVNLVIRFALKIKQKIAEISVPTKTSDLTNDSGYLTAQDISGKADASTVNTLIGGDTGKSVRTIANEELAAQLIPQNAQEALDTLQEISAWIQSHPGEVAAINHKLTLGTSDGTEYATVKAYVEAVTSGLITLSALSANVTGAGNALTGVTYNNTTGAFSFVKELTFLTEQDISGKVDKVPGKGLSTNDYTTAEKNKLSGMEAQANKTIIDATLSNAGQAADAKETGDNFAVLRDYLLRMESYCEASGNPATFFDAKAANVKALSVTITPTQSGSGAPYPPGGGKNLLPLTLDNIKTYAAGGSWNGNVYTYNGVTFTVNLDGGGNVTGITVDGTTTAGIYLRIIAGGLPLTPGTSYILSGTPSGGRNETYFIYTGSYSSTGWIDDDTHKYSREYNSDWMNLFIAIRANVTVDNLVFRPMIRLDSDTDPTFAPYSNIRPVTGVSSVTVTRTGENGANSQSVTVSLTDGSDPLTVYGGTLDVTTGTLSVTWANIASYNGETLPGRWISDRDVYAPGTTPTTGAQVVYELAAPLTYQLTPARLATLSGYNAVFSDAGNVAVTYKADTSITFGGA